MYSYNDADMATEAATSDWLLKHVPDGTWVLQEYVMNPMTYQGNKFDLRVWTMVTSLDPLRIYLLGTGIPKVSQWKYSKAPEFVKQQCIHVLLPGTTECFSSRAKEVNIIQPYPHTTNGKFWYHSMSPSGRDFWVKKAWRSLEWQLTELLLLARDSILHIDHQLKRKGVSYKRVAPPHPTPSSAARPANPLQTGLQPRVSQAPPACNPTCPRRVAFLQPDVVFDASGQVRAHGMCMACAWRVACA